MGISFDFFSSGYLDVSVPRVPFLADDAAYRVLLRLLAPRHPPYALSSLTSFLLSSHFRVPSLVTLSKLLFKRFLSFQFLLYTFQGSIKWWRRGESNS